MYSCFERSGNHVKSTFINIKLSGNNIYERIRMAIIPFFKFYGDMRYKANKRV
jgi:hypothetical protein